MTKVVEYPTRQDYLLGNGIELSLSEQDEARLVDADLIYFCDECECYHVKDDGGLEFEVGEEVEAVAAWLEAI